MSLDTNRKPACPGSLVRKRAAWPPRYAPPVPLSFKPWRKQPWQPFVWCNTSSQVR